MARQIRPVTLTVAVANPTVSTAITDLQPGERLLYVRIPTALTAGGAGNIVKGIVETSDDGSTWVPVSDPAHATAYSGIYTGNVAANLKPLMIHFGQGANQALPASTHILTNNSIFCPLMGQVRIRMVYLNTAALSDGDLLTTVNGAAALTLTAFVGRD